MSSTSETPWAAPLGRVPSGIFILTIRHAGQETGMLASWVQQAGFEPPMVTVAVKHGRYVLEWLDAGAPFVLNLVPGGESHLIRHFGKGFSPEEPAFDGVDVQRLDDESPMLAEAVGYLACQPHGHVDSGDHRVFLAKVTGGGMLHEKEPMIHVRKSGLRY